MRFCLVFHLNPRHACTARVTVLSQCLCVCLSVTTLSATTQKVIPTASVLHRQDFYKWLKYCIQKLWREKGNMLISTASSRHCSFVRYNKGTANVCIGFSWLKANNRPSATWNTSQCKLFRQRLRLCLAIFCIHSVTRKLNAFH